MTRYELGLSGDKLRIITFAHGLKSTIESKQFKNEDAHRDGIDLLEVRKERLNMDVNDAALNHFRHLAEAIEPEPADWQWIGRTLGRSGCSESANAAPRNVPHDTAAQPAE